MTLKDATLKSLEEINEICNHQKVLNHILEKGYYDFGPAKTPAQTISAVLGEFIRKGDSRVKRIKQSGGTYAYYLTKNEDSIPIELLLEPDSATESKPLKSEKKSVYEERDLHKLLVTYLFNSGVYSKTIYHETSSSVKDSGQIWTHPDIIGVRFLKLQTKASQSFLKSVKSLDAFKLYSYELKREINSDNELKKAYFQEVSNSTWANFGYLVAFEFSDYIRDEMERLNQSFGIGIIKLSANPFRSQIIFPAKYRDLDFKTIDKLCNINKDFERFIEQTEKLLAVEDRYYRAVENELKEICDSVLCNDLEIEEYCRKHNIPLDKKEDLE